MDIETETLEMISPRLKQRAELAQLQLERYRVVSDIATDPMLTVKQARLLIPASYGTVMNWIKTGKLHATKLGRKYFVRMSELQRVADKGVAL